MDAFTVAEQLIAGIDLSPGQLAQLRAINREYYTRLFALSRTPGPGVPQAESTGSPAMRTLTFEEAGELRAMLVAHIRELLTAEQRRSIAGK